jgi:hypothetical protein
VPKPGESCGSNSLSFRHDLVVLGRTLLSAAFDVGFCSPALVHDIEITFRPTRKHSIPAAENSFTTVYLFLLWINTSARLSTYVYVRVGLHVDEETTDA